MYMLDRLFQEGLYPPEPPEHRSRLPSPSFVVAGSGRGDRGEGRHEVDHVRVDRRVLLRRAEPRGPVEEAGHAEGAVEDGGLAAACRSQPNRWSKASASGCEGEQGSSRGGAYGARRCSE